VSAENKSKRKSHRGEIDISIWYTWAPRWRFFSTYFI